MTEGVLSLLDGVGLTLPSLPGGNKKLVVSPLLPLTMLDPKLGLNGVQIRALIKKCLF